MRDIHQTLHGYRDGHRLIQSSMLLTAEAERQLLLLSDNSGVLPNLEFDGYVTGYPLKKEGLYVLSRTWAAPEMNRPGCVWTHSLLVPVEIIVGLSSLAGLGTLHARPTFDGFDQYRRPIALASMAEAPSVSGTDITSAALETLMLAFYKVDKLPVLFEASSTELAELLILGIWSQCWPRLRLSLSFCTATKTPRFKEDRPLALQAIATGKPSLKQPLVSEVSAWVDTIVHADVVLWHSFLTGFAKETVATPRLMQPISQVFGHLQREDSDAEDLIETARTALSVFGPESKSERLQFAIIEKSWENLRVERGLLALMLHSETMDDTRFRSKVLGKFRDFVARAPDEGLSVVKESYESKRIYRRDLLAIWARRVPIERIPGSLEGPMLLDLVGSRQDLLTMPSTWRTLGPLSVPAFAEISEAKTSTQQFGRKVAGALITSGMFSEAAAILQASSESFFQLFMGELARLHRRMADSTTTRWVEVLQSANPAQASNWVFANLDIAASWQPKLLWQRLPLFVDRIDEVWTTPVEQSDLLDVILLITAFHRKNIGYYFEKSAQRFERVYARAKTGKLSREALEVLDSSLPAVHHSDRWDTCERMRQWFLRAFLTSGLPPASFHSLKLNEKLSNDLAKTYLDLRLGKKLDSTLDAMLLDEKERALVRSQRKKKQGLVSWLLGDE